MKILRKNFLKILIFFNRNGFCLEILIKSKINKAKMSEIPITLFKDGRKIAKSSQNNLGWIENIKIYNDM